MQIKEAIERVQSLYSRGVASEDSRLSNRHIYSKIQTASNLLVTQKINKRQAISDWNYTLLPCVKMIAVDSSSCSCYSNIGCKLVRSVERLPKPLTSYNEDMVRNIFSVDREEQYDLITPARVRSLSGNKYYKEPLAFIEDRYLYLTKYTPIKVLSLEMIPEDTMSLNAFTSCGETVEYCFDPLEQTLKVDSAQVDMLIEMCAKELVGDFMQMHEDRSNDGEEDLTRTK